jgi:hypothetical protein
MVTAILHIETFSGTIIFDSVKNTRTKTTSVLGQRSFFDVNNIDGLIKAYEDIEDNQNVIRCGTEIVELI